MPNLRLFLAGNILFTVGNLGVVLAEINGLSILFAPGLLAVPLAGLWILFGIFKMRAEHDKTAALLPTFRVLAYVALIIAFYAGLALFIGAIIVFGLAWDSRDSALAFGGIAMLLAAAIMVAISVSCFFGLLKALNGIKSGITAVAVLAYISAALLILGVNISSGGIVPLSVLFGTISLTGATICLVVLNKFKTEELYESGK